MKFGKEHIVEVDTQVKSMQEYLQTKVDDYLQNKDNSLEDRWEVWTKYSQKNHETMYHTFDEEDFPGLSDWGAGAEGYPRRGETVDYSRIIDKAEDSDEMKEYLMENNLGSFDADW